MGRRGRLDEVNQKDEKVGKGKKEGVGRLERKK